MAAHTKLMIGAGIAIAGFGLIGAGAGATFTAQVSAETSISTGSVELTLNGKTGSDLSLDVNGKNLDSHFTPITKDLKLQNTGSLDMASHFLNLTATGCDGSVGAALANALHVKLTEVSSHKDKGDNLVYDGALCSFASSIDGKGFITPRKHEGVGGQLPHPLRADETITYRVVIQPSDAAVGLPPAAHNMSTSVSLVFSGFDY